MTKLRILFKYQSLKFNIVCIALGLWDSCSTASNCADDNSCRCLCSKPFITYNIVKADVFLKCILVYLKLGRQKKTQNSAQKSQVK